MRAFLAILFVALQPSSHLADGVAALNNGDAAKAVLLLEQAVASQPTSTLALLHLANAQMANRRADAAVETLKHVLRLNPDEKLALWNLAVVPGDEGIAYLRKLIDIDPRYPHALTALATLQTMRARMQYTAAKRTANVRAEDQGWIEDAATRAALRAAAFPALDEAQAISERARAMDATAFEPLIFVGLALRMRAEIADSVEASKRLVEQADQLTTQSMTLRRQQSPPPPPGKLDPTVPPPPFPKPGAPPPPPPK